MSLKRPLWVNRGEFVVGVLSLSAVILVVGIAVLQMMPTPLRADGMSVSGGDYIMTVGALADTDEEYVYVIDTPSSKLAVYRFDALRHRIQIIQGIELSRLRTPAGEPVPMVHDDDNGDPQP